MRALLSRSLTIPPNVKRGRLEIKSRSAILSAKQLFISKRPLLALGKCLLRNDFLILKSTFSIQKCGRMAARKRPNELVVRPLLLCRFACFETLISFYRATFRVVPSACRSMYMPGAWLSTFSFWPLRLYVPTVRVLPPAAV